MHSIYEPAQQGQLDYLCGIYSLINMMSYLHGKRLKRRALKLHLLRCYDQKVVDVLELLEYGMDDEQMDVLIKAALMNGYYADHYPIKMTKPFAKGKWTTGQVNRQIRLFLAQQKPEGSRIVLFGTQYHWSLIQEVSGAYWVLYDSVGMKRVFRNTHSMIEGMTSRSLYGSAIYFCERKQGGVR